MSASNQKEGPEGGGPSGFVAVQEWNQWEGARTWGPLMRPVPVFDGISVKQTKLWVAILAWKRGGAWRNRRRVTAPFNSWFRIVRHRHREKRLSDQNLLGLLLLPLGHCECLRRTAALVALILVPAILLDFPFTGEVVLSSAPFDEALQQMPPHLKEPEAHSLLRPRS